MDFHSAESIENGVKVTSVKNFELPHVFDCGQCFRWNMQANGSYIGVALGRVIEVEKKENDLYIYNTSMKEFNELWINYFDLNRDYSAVKETLSKDPLLQKAVDFGYGIRLLQQDEFELTVSFIISSNNRIPMIKRAIENISKKWGSEIIYKGEKYYTFPTIQSLKNASLEDLQNCGVGFRARYIADTVEKIYESNKEEYKQFDLKTIKKLDDDDCHKALQNFMGIGPKVADCIMLFSMEKYTAFPVDVWVKKAMIYFYMAPDVSLKKIRDFGRDKFRELSGFAQQYLFYYARENKIQIE
ncbi:DNA glycosylase [Clostridium sp. JN-9]|uniref:DNA-3-methyladenine glycosylase family protein n=1 Tax=Clostridium sp. JN-9 TaxID=2507159 RepID=UPI000FFE18FA|nr:DNA glycosylase [Clostridium sp. JN-9]QAT39294.1 DNA-3-methyladenine glycosylase 2 family protein [Clostridium sp. JN-9]